MTFDLAQLKDDKYYYTDYSKLSGVPDDQYKEAALACIEKNAFGALPYISYQKLGEDYATLVEKALKKSPYALQYIDEQFIKENSEKYQEMARGIIEQNPKRVVDLSLVLLAKNKEKFVEIAFSILTTKDTTLNKTQAKNEHHEKIRSLAYFLYGYGLNEKRVKLIQEHPMSFLFYIDTFLAKKGDFPHHHTVNFIFDNLEVTLECLEILKKRSDAPTVKGFLPAFQRFPEFQSELVRHFGLESVPQSNASTLSPENFKYVLALITTLNKEINTKFLFFNPYFNIDRKRLKVAGLEVLITLTNKGEAVEDVLKTILNDYNGILAGSISQRTSKLFKQLCPTLFTDNLSPTQKK